LIQDEVTELLASEQALVGAAVAGGGLLLLPVALGLARRLYPEPPEARAPWGLVHVGLVLAVAMAGMVVSVSIATTLTGGEIEDISFPAQLLLGAMGTGVGALLAVFTARSMGGLEVLGLGRGGDVRAACAGIGVYLLCAPLIYGVTFIWPWVMEQFGRELAAQDVALGFLELEGVPLALAVVLGVLVIPLIEELLFRGFLLPVLVRYLGTAGGLVSSSLLFGILHGVDFVGPIACLALVLGWVQLRTGRLAAAWAVHALHNGVQVAMLVLAGQTL
jgi:membrane protease YdiL (CAAX protease family)